MASAGNTATDKALADLEKRLAEEYKESSDYMKDKLKESLSSYKKELKEKKVELHAGRISVEEYSQWVNDELMNQNRMRDIIDSLTADMTNANVIAAQMMNGEMPSICAMNANYGTYEVDSMHGLDISGSFALYNADSVRQALLEYDDVIPQAKAGTPKDKLWNKKKISSAIVQGLLTGDSIPHIADRLEQVTTMNRNAAIRNARTLTTAAQNSGRVLSYKRAEEKGIKIQQRWMATVDTRTRPSHRALDGEKIAVGGKFSNGLRYPGDPHGSPSEFYNCRCTLVAVDPLFEEEDDKAMSDLASRFSRLPDGISYEEWKSLKEKGENKSQESQKGPSKSELDKTIGQEEKDATKAPEAKKQVSNKVDGKNIYDGWKHDAEKYKFAINQAIHDQGFDGLPQVVSKAEFDEIVKQSGMISQRVYTAPDQETLDAYREALLHGEWYVDCSAGGCTEGQGMYVAADYSGKLSVGITLEMNRYIEQGVQRSEFTEKMKNLNNLTLEDIGSDKLTEEDLGIIKKYYTSLWGREEIYNLTSREDKRVDEIDDELTKAKSIVETRTQEYMKENKPVHKIETMTLDPSSKIIKMRDLEAMMNEEGLTGDEWNDDLYQGKVKFFDAGVYATLHGYDAINAEGHGASGSYTVILNRTKTYILEEE